MARHQTQAQQREEAGLLKVSMKVVTPHEDASVSLYLDGPQEWVELRDALYKNPVGGFKGMRFVIPPGLQVILLRLDDPTTPVPG